MKKQQHLHPTDIQGLSRLVIEATSGVTDVVEAMHQTIGDPLGLVSRRRTSGITGLVYTSIRGVVHLVGDSIEMLLGQVLPYLDEQDSTPQRDAALAVLNGVVGDHLAEVKNPLAIRMNLRRAGLALKLERDALAETLALDVGPAAGRILVLVHGLCMDDLQWQRNGHDHGAALAAELGYTPVYLHYNSGLHISSNGAAFAALLEELVANWPAPVEELVIVAHSMGGLVTRSACLTAAESGQGWLGVLRKIVFLGTPHSGSPLERGGNRLGRLLEAVPYSAPIGRMGKLRSAGITDLRHGSLQDSDWQGRDRFSKKHGPFQPLPLPAGVACYALAAVKDKDACLKDVLATDGLVPLMSALGENALGENAQPEFDLKIPAERKWVRRGIGHFDLLSDLEVYGRVKEWVAEPVEALKS